MLRGSGKLRGRHGGVEKRGGWKTSRMTPLPKRGFVPPLVRYVFHPPRVSVLRFSCTKIHDRADQKLFWRGPKIFGRARSLVRFPPPIRFAPPHITAQEAWVHRNCVVLAVVITWWSLLLWSASPATGPPSPKWLKYTKTSSKVGFWGYEKSSPKVGQMWLFRKENVLLSYSSATTHIPPETYFWATFGVL